MIVEPAMKVARLAQLDVGDLFIYPHEQGSCIGMIAIDHAMDDDRALLLLGPAWLKGWRGPTLSDARAATGISFGKDFCLRLPVRPAAWTDQEPPGAAHCLAVTDAGCFFRANFAWAKGEFQPCYVNAATGGVVAHEGRGGYGEPKGIRAFALEWKIVTTGAKPRTILSYMAPDDGESKET